MAMGGNRGEDGVTCGHQTQYLSTRGNTNYWQFTYYLGNLGDSSGNFEGHGEI